MSGNIAWAGGAVKDRQKAWDEFLKKKLASTKK